MFFCKSTLHSAFKAVTAPYRAVNVCHFAGSPWVDLTEELHAGWGSHSCFMVLYSLLVYVRNKQVSS